MEKPDSVANDIIQASMYTADIRTFIFDTKTWGSDTRADFSGILGKGIHWVSDHNADAVRYLSAFIPCNLAVPSDDCYYIRQDRKKVIDKMLKEVDLSGYTTTSVGSKNEARRRT